MLRILAKMHTLVVSLQIRDLMKQTLYLLILILFSLIINATGIVAPKVSSHKEYLKTSDTITGLIHPVVKQIFYDLPLEKSRKDLLDIIMNDKRFVSTDSIFNNYQPLSFFKGITADRGLIISKPDSIKFLLFLGNTSLITEKGGKAVFKDIMLVNCKYYYSSKDSVEMEYERLLNKLQPILKDSSSGKSESPYLIGKSRGQMIIVEKIFESFKPYYRVGISSTTMIPANDSKSIFVLEIVFGKEDK